MTVQEIGTLLFDEMFNAEPVQGPALPPRLIYCQKLTHPDDDSLGLSYAKALMSALYLLPDDELCRLAVRANYSEDDSHIPCSTLLLNKVIAEGQERYNRAIDCDQMPNKWLHCICQTDLSVMPAE